ncbi:aryl-alcohol dehydrogenase [Aspergillus bertholletiae]|uniref:Aryl-alcohol dehydrogenase n=1 Tax=Aspergillus bertholletiae TaxID=1226010 RepID=A0A5N7BJA4_9EURO|nr:aryl-alcohol dehydrogenase [Aspergillus bertholletiae]
MAPPIKPSYDYIIVGAGSGGLVLASRLSEDAHHNILLLEAGPNRMGSPEVETPGPAVALYGDPRVDWDYLSVPQVHANNRQLGQPRGRIVGGTSAINFSVIMYPSRADFAAWQSLGNQGWGPDSMAPYLRKFQAFTPPRHATTNSCLKPENQGTDGPIPVTMSDQYTEMNKAWDETFAKCGWYNEDDPINGKKLGAFLAPVSVDASTGRRGYAAAYYSPSVAKRPNLQLLPNAMVCRVLFTSELNGTVRATGVEIDTGDGEIRTVAASREVILCAGSLGSPLLLERSGIGSQELLQRQQIPVVINRPGVGENLQDHCLSVSTLELAESYSSVLAPGTPMSTACLPPVDSHGLLSREEVEGLLDQHLSHPAGGSQEALSLGLEKQHALQKQMLLDCEHPSSQYILMPLGIHTQPCINTILDVLSPSLTQTSKQKSISILTLLNHPFSRGSVHIQSTNYNDRPVYDPNYLSQTLDLEILARHTRFLHHLTKITPLASILKGACVTGEDSAEQPHDIERTKEMVRNHLFHCFHPVGTCAMMASELGGVVDPQLRVYGTSNLRVVDASIFPLLPVGNIVAVIYAVAERAADIIRGQC